MANCTLVGSQGRNGDVGIGIANDEKDGRHPRLQVFAHLLDKLLVNAQIDRLAHQCPAESADQQTADREKDEAVPIGLSKMLLEKVPRAELKEIKGATHVFASHEYHKKVLYSIINHINGDFK